MLKETLDLNKQVKHKFHNLFLKTLEALKSGLEKNFGGLRLKMEGTDFGLENLGVPKFWKKQDLF